MIDAISALSGMLRGITGADSTQSNGLSLGQTQGLNTGTTFVDVLKNAATDMVHDVKNAETMSANGITGKSSTREVVDAVMDADRSLQTAMAIRDKVVSAYLDITKMQI